MTYVKTLFTNIQEQKNKIKVSVFIRKFKNFMGK